jgi:hypothetical protein
MDPVPDLLRAFYDAINRNDLSAACRAFDPAIVRTEPTGHATAGTHHGAAAVAATLAQGRGTWAEGTCTPEQVLVHGDRAVALLHARVRKHGATEWTGGWFADGFVVRDGRILEWHTFWARDEALRWAGMAPGGDQRADPQPGRAPGADGR